MLHKGLLSADASLFRADFYVRTVIVFWGGSFMRYDLCSESYRSSYCLLEQIQASHMDLQSCPLPEFFMTSPPLSSANANAVNTVCTMTICSWGLALPGLWAPRPPDTPNADVPPYIEAGRLHLAHLPRFETDVREEDQPGVQGGSRSVSVQRDPSC